MITTTSEGGDMFFLKCINQGKPLCKDAQTEFYANFFQLTLKKVPLLIHLIWLCWPCFPFCSATQIRVLSLTKRIGAF